MTAAYAPTQDDGTPDPERADKLLRMLKAEENDALGYRQSELQQQQIDALKHYYGEPYGDEEPGRSALVTREVMESIEWTIPSLLRVFAGGSNTVYLEAQAEDDERYAQDAADYLNFIFNSDNPGYTNLHAFAFDGLLHRRGFIACYWREAEYSAPEKLTGLAIGQVAQINNDKNIQVLKHNVDMASNVQDRFDLTIRRTKSQPRVEIVTVAPEDMRLNGRAVFLDEARYVGRVVRKLRGEIARMFPDMANDIMQYSGAAVSGPQNIRRGSDVRMERFRDNSDDWQATGNDEAQEIEMLEEYLRVDLNDDGYPELMRSYRMGDLLLEESEVDANPFGSWSPIPIPHRFYGLSMHDITYDIQRQSTVLVRAVHDATLQSVISREAYDVDKIVDVDALLSTYTGAKIPVKGPPNEAIFQLPGGQDTAKTALSTLELLNQRLENRTGSTRQTQGMDPDALLQGPHSGKAIDLLQTAGAERREVFARNMGAGLEQFFTKLYRLVCRNQDQARQVKIGGKWCTFSPRGNPTIGPDGNPVLDQSGQPQYQQGTGWNEDLRCRVHTGNGTGNRDQTIVGVQAIMQVQQTLVETIGPDNPMVTPQEIYNSVNEFVRALGYKNCDPYMKEPPQGWKPQPPPNADAMKAQIAQQDMALKQQQMTMEQQSQLADQKSDIFTAQIKQRDSEMFAQQEKVRNDTESDKLNLEHAKAISDNELDHKKLELESRKLDLDGEKVAIQAEQVRQAPELQARQQQHEASQKDADRKHQAEQAEKDRAHQHAVAKLSAAAKAKSDGKDA